MNNLPKKPEYEIVTSGPPGCRLVLKDDAVQQALDTNAIAFTDALETTIFSPKEARQICQSLCPDTAIGKKNRIAALAKSKGVSPQILLQELRYHSKQFIRQQERGVLRHYHRTSLKNFSTISKKGALLSRSKLKSDEPDLKLPGWSASDDVMMTRDKFDSEGRLREPGFHDQEVVGASGSGVVLVLKESIMNLDDYDAIGTYPTISFLPLKEHCEAVLVDNPETLLMVQQIMSAAGLDDIPTILKVDWKR